jgi:hypothetical protein
MFVAPRSWRLVLASLVVTCAGLAAACTDPPEKEMHQAQGAIDAARAAGAAEYAADEFHAAEVALTRSTDAVTERDYRQALNYALDARERAQNAAKAAAESRAIVSSEAERLLASTEESLGRAKTALSIAADAKVPASDLRVPSTTVADAEARLAQARALLTGGEYLKARSSLADLPDLLAKATSEIDAGTEARQAKRAPRRPSR